VPNQAAVDDMLGELRGYLEKIGKAESTLFISTSDHGTEERVSELMEQLDDELLPARTRQNWFDSQRRVMRNARGELGHPESKPDWSQLHRSS
jgi:arylsulfatase A-like enzyme